MRIVITGNPNSGKTTLFNALTGKSARVGNWHGVTVSVLSAKIKINGEICEIFDLPGLKSFDCYTMEENVSLNFLKKGNYDLIINVIEAIRFDSAIKLTQDLITLNKPIVCVINMMDDLIKAHGKIDLTKLECSNMLFYQCNLTSKKEIKSLKMVIFNSRQQTSNVDFDEILNAFTPPKSTFTKCDKIFTNRFYSVILFLVCISISFYLAFGRFGIGKLFSEIILFFSDFASKKLNEYLLNSGANLFVSGLLSNGVINGVGSVLSFLPSIFILNFMLCYLEQSGIIARFSYSFDFVLSKFGLNGRSLFSLIMGFGCTTVAVQTTCGLEDKKIKSRVLSGLPFISCSAKLPVYLYICSKALGDFCFPMVVFIYLAGLLLSLLIMKFDSKISSDSFEPLIMELPILRINCLKNILKPLLNSIKQFIIKITTTVIVVSVVVYLLSSVGPGFAYVSPTMIENSFIAQIGNFITIILRPIGIYDYRIGAALFAGMFAKEAVISTITVLRGMTNISVGASISLLCFIAFYPPCIAAIDTIRQENGIFEAIYVFIFQTLFAIILSYIIYALLKYTVVAIIVLVLSCALYTFNRIKKRKNLYEKLYSNR